jgi:RNA polymerase sigma factor (sigma-70 family)
LFMTDFELLQAYAGQRQESAFTELVNRHINLVYSAALRQAYDRNTAAEIVQTVFVILARKAATISEDVVLPGWLLKTTRYTAANARRREQFRQKLEQQAMENLCPAETEGPWNEITPVLDDALMALGEKDRNLVALRFFAQKSYKEIGVSLSLSEDGARKRVGRALDKLRAVLGKHGKLLPSAVLAAAISAHATEAAPVGLAAETAGAAMAKASAAAGSVPALVRATLQSLKWARWRTEFPKLAVGVGGAAAILLAVAVAAHHKTQPVPEQVWVDALPSEVSRNPAETPTPPMLSPKTTANAGGLSFYVIDSETEQPVSDARLTLTWTTEFPARATNVFTTGPNGECLLPIDRTPVNHWNSRIEIFKNGYVPKYVSWSESQGDTINDVPTNYTTKLNRGVEIGGLVSSDNGQPIPGAQVIFSVVGQAPGASHDRERPTLMGRYHSEFTDTQGHWRCDHVPSLFSMITYSVFHPDHVTATFGTAALGATSSGGLTYLAEGDLRNGSAVFVLKPGLVVAGQIVDEAGKPVPNVKVTEDRQWYEPFANQVTGSDGVFQFKNLPQKAVVLTFQTEGFAPRDLTVNPSPQRDELRVVLDKGGLLRGRVMNEGGHPISGATVHVARDRFDQDRFEWKTTTDREGSFEWATAPASREYYTIDASGYSSQSNIELAANGANHIITLRKNAESASFEISGTVVDAGTRLPIDGFQVLMGTTEGGISPSGAWHFATFAPELRTKGKDGQFSFRTGGGVLGCLFEVRAEGYWPAQVTNSGPLTGDCHLAFQLNRAADITGSVVLPNGTPAAGAVVILCTGHGHAYMKLPAQFDLTRLGNTKHSETDADGRFCFKPELGIEQIRVAHNEGYGEASLEALASSQVITLKPWGRVEGTLKIGNRAAGNETIWLGNWYWRYAPVPGLQVHMEARTDAEGHFVFEGVPPGEREISHRVNLKPGKTGPDPNDRVLLRTERSTSMVLRPWYGQSQRTWVQVAPGQTTHVTLGGTGRTIVGTVRAGGVAEPIDWQRDVQDLSSKTPRPEAPKRAQFSSDDHYAAAQKVWSTQERVFWLSEAGREFQRKSRNHIPIFASDGSFRIEDVIPGTYRLRVKLTDPAAQDSPFNSKILCSSELDITVPESSNGWDQPPIDLGIVELHAGQD